MLDPYLQALINIIVIIGIIIIVLLTALILIRLLTSLNKKNYILKAVEWEEIYLSYLQGELDLNKAAELIKTEKRYHWLWHFFAPYLEVLDGSDFDKTKALCREIGLIDYYKKKLRRGGKKNKAIAARVLGVLRCRESTQGMLNLLQSKDQNLVQAAAYGLAKAGETDTFYPVLQALLSNTFFTYEGTTEILAAFGENICPVAAQFLQEETEQQPAGNQDQNIRSPKKVHAKNMVDPSVYRSVMIDLLGYFKYREALPVLQKILENTDEETTVHILKAFLSMGQTPANFNIEPYLEHHYWVVRNFSARVWQLTGDRQALPILERMLSDRNWWVRFHAAEALRSAGRTGLVILKQKTQGPDPNAAAISSYALSRSEVQPQL